MKHRWRKLLATPPAERRLLYAAAALVPLSRLALWMLPFSILHRFLVRVGRDRGVDRDAPSVDRIAWAVRAAAEPWRATCLPQAVSAYLLFRWHGWPAQLRIGVAKSGARLRAHAWVECGGMVAIGDGADLPSFTVLLAID